MDISEIIGGAAAPVEAVTPPTPSPVETVAAPEPQPATTAVEPEAVETREQPRNELGRFVKTEPEQPTEDHKPQRTVPLEALLEERRKRQELEARLQSPPPPPAPTVTDEQFWEKPSEATAQMVDHRTQALQQQIMSIRYDLAEDNARQLHTDYDQVKEKFLEELKAETPAAVAIAMQMGKQPNPARFVYEQTKQTLERAAPDYEAKLRAQIEAKVRAELQSQGRRPAPEVPQSLNSEPSAVISSTPGEYEPTPLANIIKFNY